MIEMKNGTGVLIFIILTCVITSKANNQDLITNKKDTVMSKIQFIPKEFHDVVCDFQSGRRANPCTPKDVRFSIRINAPKEVVLYLNTSCNREFNTEHLQLPICIKASLAERRTYKNFDLAAFGVNVRRVNSDEWQTDELELTIEEEREYYDETAEGSPLLEMIRKEEEEKQEDAQKYSDDELDVYPAIGYTSNVDLAKHSKIVFEEGEYEIYLSRYGLETNRVIVKITFKETEE